MATPYTYAVCREFDDQMTLIDDDAHRTTMGIQFRDLKLCMEPAGAAALVAVLGPLRGELQGGKRVGVIVSDRHRPRHVLRSGRETAGYGRLENRHRQTP